MPSFPMGACGVSSALLGGYFEGKRRRWISMDKWYPRYPDPERWETHVWLQRDTLVVDITAD